MKGEELHGGGGDVDEVGAQVTTGHAAHRRRAALLPAGQTHLSVTSERRTAPQSGEQPERRTLTSSSFPLREFLSSNQKIHIFNLNYK